MKALARFAVFFAMMGLSLCPAVCRAQARCLWLNAATAKGFLGGDVETTISPLSPPGDEGCEFSRKQGTAVSTLRIVVHTMSASSKEFAYYLAQCDAATAPLKGIGNEAVRCMSKSDSAGGEEKIVGRVRERVFLIIVRRSESANAAAGSGLRDDTRNIAEQVAGSLF